MFEQIIEVIKNDFKSFSFFKLIYTILVITFLIAVFLMGVGYVVDGIEWWVSKS